MSYFDPPDKDTGLPFRPRAVGPSIVNICPPVSREEYAKYRAYHKMPPSTMNYSDPTPVMLSDPLWNAIWDEIKAWDINVPYEYSGYCGATGNHVTAIFLAIKNKLQR